MVCRMIHSIYHDNTDIQFEIFNMMRNKFFGHGGDTRMKHTLPALVYATLRFEKIQNQFYDDDLVLRIYIS